MTIGDDGDFRIYEGLVERSATSAHTGDDAEADENDDEAFGSGTGLGAPPPRYAFRLEDLRAWHVVEAACDSCRHRAVIDHASLTRRRPSSMRLADLETKLRCRSCGRRGGHSFTVSLRPRD